MNKVILLFMKKCYSQHFNCKKKCYNNRNRAIKKSFIFTDE